MPQSGCARARELELRAAHSPRVPCALEIMASARPEPFLLDPEWNQAFLAAESGQSCSVGPAGLKACNRPTERVQSVSALS